MSACWPRPRDGERNDDLHRVLPCRDASQRRQPARGGQARATAAVFHALRDRLTLEEADHLAAQLPRDLQAVWRGGERSGAAPVKMKRPEFYDRVRTEAGLPSTRQARWMTLAVLGALKEALSPGEAEDVLAQLPKGLQEIWAEAQA